MSVKDEAFNWDTFEIHDETEQMTEVASYEFIFPFKASGLQATFGKFLSTDVFFGVIFAENGF